MYTCKQFVLFYNIRANKESNAGPIRNKKRAAMSASMGNQASDPLLPPPASPLRKLTDIYHNLYVAFVYVAHLCVQCNFACLPASADDLFNIKTI